jgi:hypothetical protein
MELRLFDASAHPAETQRYLSGQRQAYATHGLEAPPRAVRIIGAYDDSGQMVGALRAHFRDVLGHLPIEEYLGDPSLNALLRARGNESPVEVCGFWIHPSQGGTGLSDFVLLGTLGASRMLGAGWGCASGHHRVLPFYRKYGVSYDPSRPYAYPDERYTTYVLYIDLTWSEAPGHPARADYLALMAEFRKGRAFRFTPSRALGWDPPLAEAAPWRRPLRATG